jgi:hypothetical protein
MSPGDFPSFLKRSLDALEREAPHVYRVLCQRLDGLCLRLVVDGAPIWLSAADDRLMTATSGLEQPPAIISSRTCIEALIEARLSLLDALLADDVVMLASTDDLPKLHDAWLLYVAGAVRCRSFPALLDDFLHAPTEPRPAVAPRSPYENEVSHVR